MMNQVRIAGVTSVVKELLSLRRQLFDHRSRLPAVAIQRLPFHHLCIDTLCTDTVGPVHQAAAIAGKAEAVEPHYVNVAGSVRDAFLKDFGGFIDAGE